MIAGAFSRSGSLSSWPINIFAGTPLDLILRLYPRDVILPAPAVANDNSADSQVWLIFEADHGSGLRQMIDSTDFKNTKLMTRENKHVSFSCNILEIICMDRVNKK